MKTLGLILVTCLVSLGSLRGEPAAPSTQPPIPPAPGNGAPSRRTAKSRPRSNSKWQDSKIAGVYSNQFGNTAISNASLQDDVISFDVVRDFGGQKYVVKYHGKLEGDTISGTIEAPGHDGGEAVKLDWNAKRTAKEKAGDAKPKG